jgi:poly-gamma-glutamate synthesis protein (capsule biosynthesis protein)
MVIVARWAAITDQRRDVLDLTYGDVRRILRGQTVDWSQLGGSSQAITVLLAAFDAPLISAALGVQLSELRAELISIDELTDRVASTPGAFALVQPERLRLGVLALTVDGHDPYQDPARQSPLRLLTWVRARTTGEAVDLLSGRGIRVADGFDPVGMAMTGELIPVRCSNHVMANLNDYEVMFDGVRDVLVDADIAVAPLEHPLIETRELTPCVETVIFTGSHRSVEALANAGLDVVLTIGNHMMDCWGGCSGVAALYETLDRLHEVGIVTAGAGQNLRAARAPALVEVRTGQGPVKFAFLGYDIIAPWYHAEDDQPGTAPLEAEYLRRDISSASKLADHVLVGANWGIEYVSNPVAYQRDLGGVVMEAGATFLFGNHPHWVQAIEHFDDQLVAYSFGNFVFDQNWSVATTQGMLMELGFTQDRLLGYRIRPVVIRAHSNQLPWLYRPEFVDPAGEGRPIMDRIWNATDRLPARPVAAATIAENED